MDLFRLPVVAIVVAADVGLALAVFARNSKSAANRAFAAASVVIGGWLTLDFLCDQAPLQDHALLLNRLAVAAGVLMGALLLCFALALSRRDSRLSWPWRVFFAAGGGLIATTMLTRGIVDHVVIASHGTDIAGGPLIPLLPAWAMSGVLALIIVLARGHGNARGRQRAQLKFVLLGVALFAVSSLLLGLLLPMATGSYRFAQLTPLSTLFLVGLTAYAMVRHRFMDIRLAVLRSVAYTVLVIISAALVILPVVLIRTDIASRVDVAPDALFAVTALVAVLGFQPLRYALERATDRFFYRRTYDPDELLDRLAAAMAATLDLDEIGSAISGELEQTLRLTFATVAFRQAETIESVTTGPPPSETAVRRILVQCDDSSLLVADELNRDAGPGQILADAGVRLLAPLVADGEVLGAILLGAKLSGRMFTSRDVRVIEVLAAEAAMAMRNARLFEEKSERVAELTALNELAYSLSKSIELDLLLESALEQVVAVTKADCGSIMLLDEAGERLHIAASRGISKQIVEETDRPVGDGIAGWVAENKEPLILVGDTDPRFKAELRRHEITSAISTPVVRKDEVIGVLNVNRTVSHELFTRENLHVVTSFAGQLAVAIENARLYGDLEETFLGTIAALAATVDAKDPYTFGHSAEVTRYAVATAERLGLDEKAVHDVQVASTLHDIGKIAIDKSILHKPGRLDEKEWAQMMRHPSISADILAPLDFLGDSVPFILFHHERYGGGGYPTGISGDAIPLGARIISVADAFNAMTSDRPYRVAMPVETAIQELKDCSGTQFDPRVVEAFLEVLADDAAAGDDAGRRSPAQRRSEVRSKTG